LKIVQEAHLHCCSWYSLGHRGKHEDSEQNNKLPQEFGQETTYIRVEVITVLVNLLSSYFPVADLLPSTH